MAMVVQKNYANVAVATERYKRLQASSLEYMHLIETEARKLLEVQHQVMQASLHLEHIRKEFGGYVTSTTVLNSSERGELLIVSVDITFISPTIQYLINTLIFCALSS